MISVSSFFPVLVGLTVIAGAILACFGSPRTRLLGILGAVVWWLSLGLNLIPMLGLDAALPPTVTVVLVSVTHSVGIGLLALAAVLPSRPRVSGPPPGYPHNRYPGSPGYPVPPQGPHQV
ncbi:hypothetical protein [Enemella sp. A6]|uniref:hypothetical protein n=1 Tax=Enemella sp. A6 TaxID=3440152 RepID=UPI003EBE2D49